MSTPAEAITEIAGAVASGFSRLRDEEAPAPSERATFRVSPFAKRAQVAPMPGTPEGRSFGYVSSGVQMPAEGSCYVVEFLEGSRARVLGYVDAFGRAFRAFDVLRMPPAYTPALTLSVYEDRSDGTGCVTVFQEDGSEHRVGEFRQQGKRYALENMLVRMGEGLQGLGYDELFARLYLATCVFPEEQGMPLAPFGPGEVFEALSSDDVFTAVRRICAAEDAVEANPLQAPSEPVRYLVRQLRAFKLDELDPLELPRRVPGGEQNPAVPGAVDVRLARTRSYANAFYLGFDQDAVTPAGRSALLCLESVLNRFWLMAEDLTACGALSTSTEQECERAERRILAGLARQAPVVDARAAGPDVEAAEEGARASSGSEWGARLRFCRALERFRMPYRLSYRFRVNRDAGTMGVEATCPVSEHMMLLSWDAAASSWVERPERELFSDQADYARSVACLALAAAFASDPAVRTVSIDIVRDTPARERIVSGVVARELFAAFQQGGAPVDDVFVACGLRTLASEDGRLLPLAAARDLEGDELCPPGRYVSPETDERPLSVHAGELRNVARVEDLSISEGGERVKLADQVADAYELEGRDGALRVLKDLHDRTEDLTVRTVCTKAEMAVSEGTLGEDPRRTLADLFSDAWGLRALRARAAAQAEQDPAAARETLEQIVLLAEADGSFSDSPHVRWRYFDSYAARALFAFEDDDARPVRPLPDELFAAHHGIATLLHGSFEEHEVALEHALKCIELAPTTAAGYLALARTYFLAGDYASEIDALRRLLDVAWNPTDVGLALYWLAFALWRTDDPATGAACYLQCMKYDPSLREIAVRELDELLRESPRQHYPGLEDSAGVVERAGFPLSSVERNARRLLDAARIVADNGNLSLAATLLSSALRIVRDDALYPVLESLTRTERSVLS